MCVLAQTKPDQRDKKEQCFQSPERARISWGRATRSVVRRRDLIALGASYINALCRISIQGMYLARQCRGGTAGYRER